MLDNMEKVQAISAGFSAIALILLLNGSTFNSPTEKFIPDTLRGFNRGI